MKQENSERNCRVVSEANKIHSILKHYKAFGSQSACGYLLYYITLIWAALKSKKALFCGIKLSAVQRLTFWKVNGKVECLRSQFKMLKDFKKLSACHLKSIVLSEATKLEHSKSLSIPENFAHKIPAWFILQGVPIGQGGQEVCMEQTSLQEGNMAHYRVWMSCLILPKLLQA